MFVHPSWPHLLSDTCGVPSLVLKSAHGVQAPAPAEMVAGSRRVAPNRGRGRGRGTRGRLPGSGAAAPDTAAQAAGRGGRTGGRGGRGGGRTGRAGGADAVPKPEPQDATPAAPAAVQHGPEVSPAQLLQALVPIQNILLVVQHVAD